MKDKWIGWIIALVIAFAGSICYLIYSAGGFVSDTEQTKKDQKELEQKIEAVNDRVGIVSSQLASLTVQLAKKAAIDSTRDAEQKEQRRHDLDLEIQTGQKTIQALKEVRR
jgi:hypothetical protein